MNKVAAALMLMLLPATGASAMSKEGCGGDCAGCHSLSVKEANTLVKSLGGKVVAVKTPAMKGVWELDVEKDGKKAVAYLDYGKKHVITAPIFSLATQKPIATGIASQAAVTKVNPAAIPLSNSIILGNALAKKKLFVFTDPDCPFCAKLHRELKKLAAMEPDLAIYVKLFPLKMHPNAYDRSRAILSGQSAKLLDDAFSGIKLPAPGVKASGAAVDENIKVGRSLGINSTPTMIFPDGSVVAGAKEAAEIRALLNSKKPRKK